MNRVLRRFVHSYTKLVSAAGADGVGETARAAAQEAAASRTSWTDAVSAWQSRSVERCKRTHCASYHANNKYCEFSSQYMMIRILVLMVQANVIEFLFPGVLSVGQEIATSFKLLSLPSNIFLFFSNIAKNIMTVAQSGSNLLRAVAAILSDQLRQYKSTGGSWQYILGKVRSAVIPSSILAIGSALAAIAATEDVQGLLTSNPVTATIVFVITKVLDGALFLLSHPHKVLTILYDDTIALEINDIITRKLVCPQPPLVVSCNQRIGRTPDELVVIRVLADESSWEWISEEEYSFVGIEVETVRSKLKINVTQEVKDQQRPLRRGDILRAKITWSIMTLRLDHPSGVRYRVLRVARPDKHSLVVQVGNQKLRYKRQSDLAALNTDACEDVDMPCNARRVCARNALSALTGRA